MPFCLHSFCGYLEGWDPVNWFNHTSNVAVVTPADRPKSVRNCCVIEVFGGGFVLSLCFLEISVCVRAFVIGLSQISFFFSSNQVLVPLEVKEHKDNEDDGDNGECGEQHGTPTREHWTTC